MIYVHESIEIIPGKVEDYLNCAAKFVPLFERHGLWKLKGMWSTGTGEMDKVMSLGSLKSYADYEKLTQVMEQDEELIKVLEEESKLRTALNLSLLHPAPFSPLK